MSKHNPQFPLFIPSKGRFDTMITSRALDEIGVPHRIVVEEQEYKDYLAAVNGNKSKLVVLDLSYKQKYELCDDLGLTKSTGPGPARNFIWDYSKAEGHAWHWVMDDNIKCFRRMTDGARVKVADGAIFQAMEDFVLRYRNIGMAGPNYTMFAFGASKLPPFVLNTRIYSCNLIRNDLPYRWRGRYNEDTILSLDMLKAGWCTVQFNAFLQEKLRTQTIKGGNTEEFYAKEGTLNKSRMQTNIHPDVSRVVWKFGRWHHHVNYGPFKKNKLILKPNVAIDRAANEYGMALKKSI
ncbi:hypothetical protein UFOVP306_8 [uncultured Caudovirales phage]|uniref:TET-Associated Glycosyltransferase domain-containing protein n=1 Tax=uncultured Caudovirales phage TaxID=2100421 RepID=A0A6J5LTQ2_9CAUD|nr:hypothetical protein UFOVP306_8 [uncultured Caudovirales phage]